MDARELEAFFSEARQPPRPDATARRLHRLTLSTRQQCRLFSRTGSLLSAGLSLVEALELQYGDCRHRAEAQLLTHCLQSVSSGHPLSDALGQCPTAVSAHHVDAVRAGEMSGQVASVLTRLGLQLDHYYRSQQQVRRTIRYPVGVLIFAMGVTVAMLWYVVPVFEQLFAQQKASLPVPTQTLLVLAAHLRDGGPALGIGMALTPLAWRWAMRRQAGRNACRRCATWLLPGLGTILNRTALARALRLLSLMLNAGIPIADALGVAADATDQPRLAGSLKSTRTQLIAGRSLHLALAEQSVWPPFVHQLIRTGEASGQLDTMLDRAAELLEQSVEQRSGRLLALLEPMIMAILAVLVGGLLLALYLPVFSMGAAF